MKQFPVRSWNDSISFLSGLNEPIQNLELFADVKAVNKISFSVLQELS